MARNTKRRRRKPESDRRVKKKPCYFCVEKIDYVDYKDVALLRRYMSERAKIRSSRVTGNCAQHQRKVAQGIKNAREVALLPYVAVGTTTPRRR